MRRTEAPVNGYNYERLHYGVAGRLYSLSEQQLLINYLTN